MGYRSELSSALRNYYKVPDEVLRMMDDEAQAMADHIVRRTYYGYDADNRPFAPYADSTAKRKGRHNPVTLRETGRLHESVAVRNLGSRVRSRSVLVRGDRRQVGAFHQYGTVKMPQRRWFGLTEPFRRDLEARRDVNLRRVTTTRDRRRSIVIGATFG